MYGNSPRGPTAGGPSFQDPIELTPEQRQIVRGSINRIRSHAENLLPLDYDVGTDIQKTPTGPAYSIAVIPPTGYPVSVEFDLTAFAEQTTDGIVVDNERLDFNTEECKEVAHQLVASAIIQAKHTDDDHDTDLPAA